MHSSRYPRAMTDDDFTLNFSDAAQWNAIVTSEWPSRAAHPTTLPREKEASAIAAAFDAQTPELRTIYLPRRPAAAPLVMGMMLTVVSIWIALCHVVPAFQLAARTGLPRQTRADTVHQFTVAAALIAVISVLAVACCSVWLVSFARYRLRRSSCDHIAARTTTIGRYIHPPNPATAATWLLLLLTASAIAGWWIAPRLDTASSADPDAIDAFNAAVLGGLAWLAVVMLCAALLTIWAAREARHRLRRAPHSDARG